MSLNTDTTMQVVPANCGNGNGGMWGGDWSSWIILFLIFGMFGFGGWGGGFGGGFGGGWGGMNGGVGAEVQRGFDNQAVVRKLDGITQGICDASYALNNTIVNGFHGVDNAVCNLGYNVQQGFNQTNIALMQGQNALQAQLADCCCTTQRAIDGINYNLATQSCDTRNALATAARDITDNQNANARAILDAMTAQRIEMKDQRIAEQNQTIFQLQLAASQANQNSVLMAAMDANVAEVLRRTGHSCPTPAYVVQPPTPVTFNCGTGYAGYGYGGCNPCGANC